MDIGLPVLETREFANVDDVDRTFAELRLEIAALERELADVETAIAEAEKRASVWGTRPDADASAIQSAMQMVDEWLATERAEIRATTEDAEFRAATYRILEARKEAEQRARTGPAGGSEAPVEHRDADVLGSRSTDDHLSDRIAAACQRALRDVGPADAAFEAAAAETDDDGLDDGEGRAGADRTGDDLSAGAGDRSGVRNADEAFDAFWRDEQVAAASRGSFLQPLDALAPMVLLVALLALVLVLI